MALILATNQQGKTVIADSGEAKSLGYTPVTNSQNNNSGAAASGQAAPENVNADNKFSVTASDLVSIANKGGGVLSVPGQTYDVKPTQQAVQNQQTTAVGKAVGEPVKYGGGQSNAQHGEGTVYYGTSGTQYFYSPDQEKIYWNKGQVNTTQNSKPTLPASNNTYYNPFRNETFKITTKPDYIQQGDLARLTYQANNLNPAELLAYAIWNPFQFRSTIPGFIAILQGQSPEQVKQIMFQSGQIAFKEQAYYHPTEFYESMALGSLAISSGPASITGVQGTILTSFVNLGAYEYDFSRRVMENNLDTVSAGIDVSMMVLSSMGVYTGLNQVLNTETVDPILSKIDVAGYHQSAEEVPQTKYVPILGKEFTYVQNQETLDVKLLGTKPIYGIPQDMPVEIKDFDNLVQLNIREDQGGLIKTSSVTFKSTDQGVEPTGGYTNTQWIPYERQPMMHVLDMLGPDKLQDWQLNAGMTNEIKLGETKPILSVMEGETSGTSRVVNMKVLGIEKPEEYVPDMMQPSKVGPWITTGDATGVTNPNAVPKVDEYTIPIDLTHGPLSIDFESGKGTTLRWLTDEDYLKETATPIGQEVIETTPRHIIVNTGETPTKVFVPQVGWVPSNERENKQGYTTDVGRINEPDTNLIINTGNTINEKETPIDFVNVGENNINNILNNQGSGSVSFSGQGQSQGQRQDQLEMQTTSLVYRDVSVNVSQTNQSERGREPNPDDGDLNLPFRSSGGSPLKVIIINSAGMRKSLKVFSLNLPTASDMSLEKAFSKFGHGSLARGPGVEKAYRENAATYGLASVGFPAAEMIKRIRGGYKR